MSIEEIRQALGVLSDRTEELERLYIENDGECTKWTEAIEAEIVALQELLAGGVDDLGRWLKAVEDDREARKAERDAAIARVKASDRKIEHIRNVIATVMNAGNLDKVKGTYYNFTAYEAKKSTVNQEELDNRFLSIAEDAVRKAGIPQEITISLKSTANALEPYQGEGNTGTMLDGLLDVQTSHAVKFGKPRKSKDVA